jgi:hypothetical protein
MPIPQWIASIDYSIYFGDRYNQVTNMAWRVTNPEASGRPAEDEDATVNRSDIFI